MHTDVQNPIKILNRNYKDKYKVVLRYAKRVHKKVKTTTNHLLSSQLTTFTGKIGHFPNLPREHSEFPQSSHNEFPQFSFLAVYFLTRFADALLKPYKGF